MKRGQAIPGFEFGRQAMALTLAVLLVPFMSGNLDAQGVYAPLDAVALDQLVAPIALYPDSLVAQILTAATYPQQVSEAANWSRQNSALPPQERADIANGMPWDPSVQALTAFPSVLDNLARNYNWMQQLGNAYYNQPADVMNAVQAARVQAQQAGYLRTTPQLRVYYDGPQILIAPVNPELVYVPYYDPWRIYGGWISPYSGYYLLPPPRGVVLGLGLAFAAGISIGFYAHYGWGFHHWEPNWRGGTVIYNNNTYISNSVTVYNHGNFGGYNRGVYEHAGRGVPSNFHPVATRESFARVPAGRGVETQGPVGRGAEVRGPAGRSPEGRAAAGRAPIERTGPPRTEAGRPAGGSFARTQENARPTPHVNARPAPEGRIGGPSGHAGPAPHAAPQQHSAPRAEPRSFSERPAPRTESRPAPRAESRPAPRAESRPAPRAESRPAPRAESRPVPRAESRPAPRAESRPAPRAESRPAPRAESRPAPQGHQGGGEHHH